MLVVDASVLAVALADDGPDGDAADTRLRGETLAAPELVDLEVASVLRRQNRVGLLDDPRAGLAMTDLGALPMHRAAHLALLPRCWELRDNLTSYLTAYVALAEALEATLLTGDRRLAHAPGPTCTPIDVQSFAESWSCEARPAGLVRASARSESARAQSGCVSPSCKRGAPQRATSEVAKHEVTPADRAQQERLNHISPRPIGPRYGHAMRLNYVAAAASFVASVVFFLTRNIALGAVFLSVGAVFVALDTKPPKSGSSSNRSGRD